MATAKKKTTTKKRLANPSAPKKTKTRKRKTTRKRRASNPPATTAPRKRRKLRSKRRRARNPPKVKMGDAAVSIGKGVIGGVVSVGLTGLAQQLSPSLTVDKVMSIAVPAVLGLGAALMGQREFAIGAGGVAGAGILSLVSESVQRAPVAPPIAAQTQAAALPAPAANPPDPQTMARLMAGTHRQPYGKPPLRAVR